MNYAKAAFWLKNKIKNKFTAESFLITMKTVQRLGGRYGHNVLLIHSMDVKMVIITFFLSVMFCLNVRAIFLWIIIQNNLNRNAIWGFYLKV